MLLNSAQVVVLAGGASRRMGSPKALLPFGTESQSQRLSWTFLDQILEVYRKAGIERATVVWPYSARRDERILHYLAHPKYVSVKVAHEFHNDPYASRLDSVLRGLRHSDRTSSTFLQDVDRPFITASVLGAILARHEMEGYAAPNISGKPGHPLLLSPRLVSQFCQLRNPRDLMLRDVLEPYPCSLVPVSAEESTKLDININTPEEYRTYFSWSLISSELVPA